MSQAFIVTLVSQKWEVVGYINSVMQIEYSGDPVTNEYLVNDALDDNDALKQATSRAVKEIEWKPTRERGNVGWSHNKQQVRRIGHEVKNLD